MNPDDFIANHYPSEIRWILLLEKPGLTDFFNAPIKTTAFLENRMVHYSPDTGKNYINRDSLFNFSFTLNQRLESFFAEAITYRNKQSITEILPEVPKLNKEGYYCISHAFEKKGEYDLRIYINDRLTFIYKVFVR